MRKKEKLFKVTLESRGKDSVAAEVLKAVLGRCGFFPEQVAEFRDDKKIALSVYLSSGIKASALCRRLEQMRLRGVRLSHTVITPQDWRDRWKTEIPPFALGKKFMVVPVWHRRGFDPGRRQPIFLDTTLAFGTGLHETTRFMAQLIERQQEKIVKFLDVGTGTGLLAIIAAFCGARQITAIDNDPHCIQVARKNFQLNGVNDARTQRQDFRLFKPRVQLDYIAANLVTDDLIACRKKFIALLAGKGFLAVSGISLNNLSRFQQAFRPLSLRCCRVLRGRKWAAVLYQKV